MPNAYVAGMPVILLSLPRFTLKVTIFITLHLHMPYQGPLPNKDSRKHLIFPILGILKMFEGGVTQVSTFEVIRGEDSIFCIEETSSW